MRLQLLELMPRVLTTISAAIAFAIASVIALATAFAIARAISFAIASLRLSSFSNGIQYTVRSRGMGTDVSEASKRVPIFSFATQGGKQVSSYFRQEVRQGQELRQGGLNRLRFGPLLHDLSPKG